MSATAVAAIKAAILALTDESTRKKIGWVLVAILSPIILVVALICSIFSSTSQHNVSTVELCFHGGTISASATPEYRQFILEMRESFSMLDSMVEEINSLLGTYTVDALQTSISWLMGWPAGLKLNSELAAFLGDLFLWVIAYWAGRCAPRVY